MKTKRERVSGPGPKRHELKTFSKLGEIDSNTVDLLKKLALSDSSNDLGSDSYNITQSVDLSGVFGVKLEEDLYRQILLQKSPSQATSEFNYTEWDSRASLIKDVLSKYFDNIYRFRISIMKPHNSINWHIDTDTSVCCRAQIAISGNDSVMEFKTKSGIDSLIISPGELFFINTGWPHRVVTNSDIRISSIFSFQFSDIKDKKNIFL